MTELSQYSPILKTTGFGGKHSQPAIITPSTNPPSEASVNVSLKTESQDSTYKTKLEKGLSNQLLGKRRSADTEFSTVPQRPKKKANFNPTKLYFSFSAYHIHCMKISTKKKRKKRKLKYDLGDFVPAESTIKARRLLNAQKQSSKEDATSDP
ncbi:hypothetical protein L5515_017120 [Caenorhabditis briggsae]|uniref:Uncharacterized protein n=1 Tax=Caenorhabditis briggsae TaxID=6238 RepID=A0AAE9JPP2_CAEBR|nr:hypothetical protein L5515_017120 [Caenorhabditis briggsae]